MDRDAVIRIVDHWSDDSASFFFRGGLGRVIEYDWHTDSLAYVISLTSSYEERSIAHRSAPHRGEGLISGHFDGIWSQDFQPRALFTEETREVVVPGTESISTCAQCSGAKRVCCSRCAGAGRSTCSQCGGQGSSTCLHCQGHGRVACGTCIRGEVACNTCSGSGRNLNGQVCYSCNGQRRVRCLWCSGAGERACGRCSGARKIQCMSCAGAGEHVCRTCAGVGDLNCPSCDGAGEIRTWKALVVHFYPKKTIKVIGNGPIPGDDIIADRGLILCESDQSYLSDIPEINPEVDQVAKTLDATHHIPAGDEARRLLRQSFSVREIPVTELHYHLRSKSSDRYAVWVHGQQQSVWTNRAPRAALLDWRAIHFAAVLAATLAWLLPLALQPSAISGVLMPIGTANSLCAGIYLWIVKSWDWDDRGEERHKRLIATPLWCLMVVIPTLLHISVVPILLGTPRYAQQLLVWFGISSPTTDVLSPSQRSSEAEQHYQAGVKAKKATDFQLATNELLQSVQLNPKHLRAHFVLAWCRLGLGQDAEAISEFKKVIEVAPRSREAAESRNALARLQNRNAPSTTLDPAHVVPSDKNPDASFAPTSPYRFGYSASPTVQFRETKCPDCGGTKHAACVVCGGRRICTECGGRPWRVCFECGGQKLTSCMFCMGTGYFVNDICSVCRGRGVSNCLRCKGAGIDPDPCGSCRGTGKCEICKGSGQSSADCFRCSGTGIVREYQ
jgi:hypothetical protein